MTKDLETRKHIVQYHHYDGRKGTVEVTTVISKSEAFDYGNGKAGMLIVGDDYGNVRYYDLRYNTGTDLHLVMIRDYFGKGLERFTEITV